MPSTSRRPNSVFEERIDFERIERDQTRRHNDTLKELRILLKRIEDQTLRWVTENLAKKKLKMAINKFEMPLHRKYQEVLRRRVLMAYRRGRSDVGEELGINPTDSRAPALTRVRQRADTLALDHKTTLETELRRAWSLAMTGNINQAQLVWATKQVFADFAGWKPPEAP